MACSMAAALAFNIIMDRRRLKHSQLLVGVLLVAVLSFAKLSGVRTESGAFWLFCLLQACIGVFGPCVGYLKGHLIDDNARSTVYSISKSYPEPFSSSDAPGILGPQSARVPPRGHG